jgi:zinc D-Ala-D-Ala carboxypeptidase
MILSDWDSIKFFKPEEFDDPSSPGSGSFGMNLDFVKTLEKIRFQCNFPFKINSGFRTQAHNDQVGGVPDSAHTKGLACDIGFQDHSQLYTIIQYAMQNGIKRIGISFKSNFVHLDSDLSLPQGVIWTYEY